MAAWLVWYRADMQHNPSSPAAGAYHRAKASELAVRVEANSEMEAKVKADAVLMAHAIWLDKEGPTYEAEERPDYRLEYAGTPLKGWVTAVRVDPDRGSASRLE
jgi:hypothetical protein